MWRRYEMFSKDYIELCKIPVIQELRPELEIGDWLLWLDKIEGRGCVD